MQNQNHLRKIMMKNFTLMLSFAFSLSAFSQTCPRPAACDQLEDTSWECHGELNKKKCLDFVIVFDQLLGSVVCKESKTPVTALHLCGQKKGSAALHLHYDRIAQLPSLEAIKVFTSQRFRNTLDGDLAEQYMARSKRQEPLVGKELKSIEVDFKCRAVDSLEFKNKKVSASEYEVYVKDESARIRNIKTKKECTPDVWLLDDESNDVVKKINGKDLFLFNTYSGGDHKTTLVDANSCKTVWDKEEKFSKPVVNTVNKVSSSSWKECAACWNEYYQGCLRY